MMATDVLPVPLQDPLVTVMPSVTLPEPPAVKLIPLVPCPLLIVPPVIVHAYVAPACEATLALALPFGQMFDGARIDEAGEGLIGIDALELLPQPFALTLTATVTFPEEPAVNVMALVAAPPVIVPLVIVHEYVAPL